MPRTLSRSPSYRRRYSPSPASHRYSSSRRSRRDRSRSPYSCRRKSRSPSPRRRKNHSPTLRPQKSRSPTLRQYRRQRSRSMTKSPLAKSRSPSLEYLEQKNVEKLLKEEEKRKRRQQEAELKLLEEETTRRVEEAIRKKVDDSLNSEEFRMEIQKQVEQGRKKMLDEVAVQLEKETCAALKEARVKEEKLRREGEELDKVLDENRQRVEEAQSREAVQMQQKDEERYRELVQIQKQKEETMRRKKLEEDEVRTKQMMLLGKNKSRPKLSFALGSK